MSTVYESIKLFTFPRAASTHYHSSPSASTVTIQSAKPFHRLLVHTVCTTPGVSKVNKNILNIIYPIPASHLPITPKGLQSLRSDLDQCRVSEGGTTRCINLLPFWRLDYSKIFTVKPQGNSKGTPHSPIFSLRSLEKEIFLWSKQPELRGLGPLFFLCSVHMQLQ